MTSYQYEGVNNLILIVLPNDIIETRERESDDLNCLTFWENKFGQRIQVEENNGRIFYYVYSLFEPRKASYISDTSEKHNPTLLSVSGFVGL